MVMRDISVYHIVYVNVRVSIKSCDSNFEVFFSQIFNVATNETTAMH